MDLEAAHLHGGARTGPGAALVPPRGRPADRDRAHHRAGAIACRLVVPRPSPPRAAGRCARPADRPRDGVRTGRDRDGLRRRAVRRAPLRGLACGRRHRGPARGRAFQAVCGANRRARVVTRRCLARGLGLRGRRRPDGGRDRRQRRSGRRAALLRLARRRGSLDPGFCSAAAPRCGPRSIVRAGARGRCSAATSAERPRSRRSTQC